MTTDNSAEIIARWEWFRRPAWGAAEYALLNPLFAKLFSGRSTCLYSGGALGRSALDLASTVAGSLLVHLPSNYGVERGKELARSRNLACAFVGGDRAQIAQNLPHPVDCIVSPNWMLEPDWNTLKGHFGAAHAALNDGGLLAFPSPKKNDTWKKLLAMFDGWEDDAVVWNYRDGATACVCMRSKFIREKDFADVKYRYIATKDERGEIYPVIRRLPAYWEWRNVVELGKAAGFEEIDSCEFPRGAAESEFSELAILRKSGKPHHDNHAERLYAYADF